MAELARLEVDGSCFSGLFRPCMTGDMRLPGLVDEDYQRDSVKNRIDTCDLRDLRREGVSWEKRF